MNFGASNGPMRSAGIGIVTGVIVGASAMPALAHSEQGQAQGLVSGLLHPISGLDHVVAMVAVGIWGAQLGMPAIWLLPVVFPLVMAFGGFLGLINMPVPGVEYGIALSALLLGIAVALEARPSLWVAALLVGMFAIFHGHAHGAELPAGQSALMYSIGFVAATGCLHGVGILLGLLNNMPAGKSVLRASGAAIAIAGAVFLWRAFA